MLDAAYAFDDSDHLARFFDSDASADLLQGFEDETGVHTLGAWSAGMREFTANEPIREPGDLDGLRMRFPNSPQFLMNAKALGADATEVAYEELFLALQQGTVDGQENPITNIAASSLQDVQDYISMSNHQANSNLVIIGADAWGELSARAAGRAAAAAVDAAEEQVPGCVAEDEEATLAEWEESGAHGGRRRRRRRGVPHPGRHLPPRQLQRGAARGLRGHPGRPRSDRAGEVQTFRGPVAAAELGTTLIHEHVFVGHPELDLNLPHPEWDEDVAIETAVAGLERLWELGVRTVVDLTVLGPRPRRRPGRAGGRADPRPAGRLDRLLHGRRAAGVLPDPRPGPAGRRAGPAGGALPPRHRGRHRRHRRAGRACSRSSPTSRASPPTYAG